MGKEKFGFGVSEGKKVKNRQQPLERFVAERNAEIEGERTDFKYRTHLWKLGLLRSQWQKHCDWMDHLNNPDRH